MHTHMASELQDSNSLKYVCEQQCGDCGGWRSLGGGGRGHRGDKRWWGNLNLIEFKN